MSEELKDDLSNYNKDAYEKPSVTVDDCICRIVDNKLKVLLIQRSKPPFRDHWAIPGGFLDVGRTVDHTTGVIKEPDPSLECAALRELKEETSVIGIPVHQLKSYGDINRDPRMRVVTVAYFAIVNDDLLNKVKVEAGDDAKKGSAQWIDMDNLPALAFDHAVILDDLRERLQGRIQYTDLAFQFLSTEFTWAELQNVYEIILNRKLVASNFRRKIKSLYNIEYLDTTKETEVGRPAKLLKYKGQKPIF